MNLSVITSPFRFIFRVLSFRFTAEDLNATSSRHLLVGLLFTWIAGMGRYWDNPRVSGLQASGVGSIIYVIALTTFIWLLFIPLRPTNWKYFKILTFIAAVSPPALIYAIPVERYMSLDEARLANVSFLAAVALWRVLLYWVFLYRFAGFRWGTLLITGLLPLALIVFALASLNLERAVFDIMSGNSSDGTSADASYEALFIMTMFGVLLAPVLVLAYIILCFLIQKNAKSELSQD